MHEIRFCRADEQARLIAFIDTHWKKDHIFTKDTALLDWQHYDPAAKRYNFVVAYNKETMEFDALLGFIPSSQFDPALSSHREVWLAIWKIKEEMAEKVSGLQLLFFLKTTLKPLLICSIGITENVKGIYDALRYKQGMLSHYYIPAKVYTPVISDIVSPLPSIPSSNSTLHVKKVPFDSYRTVIEKMLEDADFPVHKSWEYLSTKYIAHPVYDYFLLGIFDGDTPLSFCIARQIHVEGSSCIRIVDYFGPFPDRSLYHTMQTLLQESGAEYIDFLCHLSDFTPLERMGFVKKETEDIIPEYFEPFMKKNVPIYFAYHSKAKEVRIFKADSDQDRPSLYRKRTS